MRKIKICAVQSEVSPDFSKNIIMVEQFFKKADKRGCDIICFPEMFLTGPLNRKNYDRNVPVSAKKRFSDLSKKFSMFSVMGSMIEKINGNFYNISYLFDDKGCIIGDYKKNHLVQKSEAKYMKAGHETPVFKTKIGNIGIEICRDLLYPEVTRRLMVRNADMVLCPSFWSSESSSYDWLYNNKYFKKRAPREVDALVSARAIESELIFVYVNAAGSFDADGKNTLLGRTQIAVPFYGTTDILDNNKEGLIIKEVDVNIVKDAKKVYKIESDLKGYYKNNKI